MTDLTLYTAMPSRGMTAQWLLEELDIDYNLRVLDLASEEHKRPEYQAINPMERVPALVHGDTVVTESAAIVTYLAETFENGRLSIAPGSPARGAYLRWLHFAAGSAESSIIWEMLRASTPDLVDNAQYKPFADTASVTATLREALTGREFILENRFTAADVIIGSTLMWGLTLAPVLPQDPVLLKYWQALAARPAWQKVWAQMPT